MSNPDLWDAVHDPNLLLPYLQGRMAIGIGPESYKPWLTCIRAMIGRKITSKYGRDLVFKCMGVEASTLPREPRKKNLLLVGRRGGKSFLSGLLGAHSAVFSGKEKYLSKGERGLVAVVAPSIKQAKKTKEFLRLAFEAPLLRETIRKETAEGFLLKNNVEVQVLGGNPSLLRGWSLLAAIIDEACHFQLDAETKKKSDLEVIRAVVPGLLNAHGSLYVISSPYIEAGWCHSTWERCWGKPDADTFVWRADCLTMNPSLTKQEIDDEIASDPEAGRSEYYAEWRQSASSWLTRGEVMSAVVKGRRELMYDRSLTFTAFTDLAGGAARGDDAVCAIGRREGRKVVVYQLLRYRPPFNPHEVVKSICKYLKAWNIRRVKGDYYAAEFGVQAFAASGIRYIRSELNASELLREMASRLRSNEIELLDDADLIKQACQLVVRCKPGSPEKIAHPVGGHDDLIVSVAGLCHSCANPKIRVGSFPLEGNSDRFYDDGLSHRNEDVVFVPRPFLR